MNHPPSRSSEPMEEHSAMMLSCDTAPNYSDKQSPEDRYFSVLLDHIGSSVAFDAHYSANPKDLIGVGSECIVYSGQNKQSKIPIAIKQMQLSSKAELIDWFAHHLSIKQCQFYNLYQAYLINHNAALSQYTVALVQDLLDINLCEAVAQSMHHSRQPPQSSDDDCECDSPKCLSSPILSYAAAAVQSSSRMDEDEVRRMTSQIVGQLSTLEEQHELVHLDVKPSNIMRTKDNNYTLIDFGFSMEHGSHYRGYVGTKYWSAPEIVPHPDAHNKIAQSTDMWSVALVVIYCLFEGHHPLAYKKNKSNSLRSIQKWYDAKLKDRQCYIESWLGKQLVANTISYDLFDFLFKCLRFNADKRLTPKQAMQHAWLKQ